MVLPTLLLVSCCDCQDGVSTSCGCNCKHSVRLPLVCLVRSVLVLLSVALGLAIRASEKTDRVMFVSPEMLKDKGTDGEHQRACQEAEHATQRLPKSTEVRENGQKG